MPSGTGIDKLIKEFPTRFWDVAIAEQHAVTSMAAMAKEVSNLLLLFIQHFCKEDLIKLFMMYV